MVVQCGTYTKAYAVQKMTALTAKKLYANIAAIEARRQRMLSALPAEVPAAAVADPMDTLRKLAALHDSGLLTDEEFAEKRAEIIARI